MHFSIYCHDPHTDNQTVFDYYHHDHLDMPIQITDKSGKILWATITTSTLTSNLRFPGQYHDDETGMHYNWNRYYDPSTGRYVTQDPIGLEGGINHYLYAEGNPLSWIDPEGKMSWADFSQLITDYTGGCNNNSFLQNTIENYTNVMDEIGLARMGLTFTFGGMFAKNYGGITVGQALLQIYKQILSPYGFRGLNSMSVGINTVSSLSRGLAATSLANTILISGMFSSGVLIGSAIRSGVNKAFSSMSCECS